MSDRRLRVGMESVVDEKSSMGQVLTLDANQQDPLAWFEAALSADGTSCLVQVVYEAYWSAKAESAHCWVGARRRDGVLQFWLSFQPPVVPQAEQAAQAMGLVWVALGEPCALQPVAIPKPWGQEIWYTGIEARGCSSICWGNQWLPLHAYLAVFGTAVGASRDLVLLKILDPLAEPVFGDLYFELHRQKQEVYVVTHVATEAWPDGVGGIRLGFADHAVDAMGESNFRQQFLDAVADYRQIRRQIDRLLDQQRHAHGVALDTALMPEMTKRWLADLPSELLAQEAQRRAAMEALMAVYPLREGDVVAVPLLTPHSLMHGVRTIEFQTPVYERLIIAFAQKVLTQSDWDTEQAMAVAQLRTELLAQHPASPDLPGERIVDFDDFVVDRLRVDAGQQLTLPPQGYGILIGVTGEWLLNGQKGLPEQAFLLPSCALQQGVQCVAVTDAVVLFARPN